MKIAIGEALLSAHGALSNIQCAKNSKQYEWLFKEKQRLNSLLRDLKVYKFDKNIWCEREIWTHQYQRLLERL